MAQNLQVCEIDDGLLAKLKKFRFNQSKTNFAIVMKIIPNEVKIVEDPSFDEDELEDISIEDLAAELPAHQPRYVAYSYVYKHDDGRISYPLCFFFVSPAGTKPELQMMYAGSKLQLVQAGGFTKVFEVRSTEELTEEYLISKLKFFR